MNLDELFAFINNWQREFWEHKKKGYEDKEFIKKIKSLMIGFDTKENIEYQEGIIKNIYVEAMEEIKCIPNLGVILDSVHSINIILNGILENIELEEAYKTDLCEKVLNKTNEKIEKLKENNKNLVISNDDFDEFISLSSNEILDNKLDFIGIEFKDIKKVVVQNFITNVLNKYKYAYLALENDALYWMINNGSEQKNSEYIYFNDSQIIINKELYIAEMQEAIKIIGTSDTYFNSLTCNSENKAEDEIFKFRIIKDRELAKRDRVYSK